MSGFNTPALLFGLILLVASIALFLFGRVKPEIQRDSDNIYALIGVVCSLILFASAFDLSLGMSFQQLLMIGALITLMWENIQSRQPTGPVSRRGAFETMRQGFSGDQGRRNGPMNDPRGAAPNNVYRYEASLDDYDRFNEPRRDQRRIRGSEPPRGAGYDDRYDASGRRPSLNEADRSRNPGPDARFDDRGRGGRDDFAGGGRSDGPPGRRPERNPRRNDWEEDNYVDGRRPPAGPNDGFGPDRNAGRDSGRGRGSRPRDERSMEGRPLSRPLEDEGRRPMGGPAGGPMDGPNSSGPNPNGPAMNGPSMNAPGMDRPPIDMPPRRRPRPSGPADRPGPGGAPMGGGYGPGPSDRPGRRPPGSERPVIDATPAPPSGNRPLTPPPGAPMQPLDTPAKDDYVDFKPVSPPPDSERDNSDQFDD